jgi:DegV family protein with EDD domain
VEAIMVQIITDTTACLDPQFALRHNLPVIPQIINFGEQSFYEGIDIDNAAFLKRLTSSPQLPTTAAPPPELFVEQFNRLVPLGEPILCIHPSAEISGTVRSAQVAAQDFPGADIRVIDTRLVASALRTLVELAVAWKAEGLDADTITARLNDLSSRSRVYFLVPTLEYLKRGGRIGGAKALLSSMLQIKPILALQNGRVESYENERTHKRALERLKEIVRHQLPPSGDGYLSVMHAGVPDEAKTLADDLKQSTDQVNIPIVDMPPAIVTHGGPGLLGVSFFVHPT